MQFRDEAISNKHQCIPKTMPALFDMHIGIVHQHGPGELVIQSNFAEQEDVNITVWMDGRKHPGPHSRFYQGDSIGWYEGNELVIETTNFNGLTRLDTAGHPQSDQLKVTERFTRTDAGHMAYQMTLEDPKTYTKPLVMNRTFTLRTDWEILEYSCEENNKGLVEGRIKVPNYDKAK